MQNQDPLIGQQIDDYQIDDLLGHGGMGRVYRAQDVNLKRYVALKVMTYPSNKAKTYEKRFYREAQAIAKLKHSNIVAIYRINASNDVYYMAMEYVDGADLRWVLRDYAGNGELIDYYTLLKIMEQISSALDYAHKHGVIHRDIKPSNIMISRDGNAVLTDFGLALDVDEGTGGEIFGSPHYIAPEQAVSSAQAVPQTDFYSLGVILFEMLTGVVPFDVGSAVQIAMAHIGDPLPDPKMINPNLHPAFIPILERCLEKSPKDRYQNGAKFINALKSAIREAEKAQSSPEVSKLGRPKDRIAHNLKPLPQPIRLTATKPATMMADESFISEDEPPTKMLPEARIRVGRPRRRSYAGYYVLLIIAFSALAFTLYPERDAVIAQIQDIVLSGAENQIVNALIEGEVDSNSISIDRDYATITVHGVSLQIPHDSPLYDTIQDNDNGQKHTVLIEGHYMSNGDSLRFDTIVRAVFNGEEIDLDETE